MKSKFFFPIERSEFKAFFFLASLMFFIIFNNTMVRNLKDSFLVMNNGALSIAFIKLWGVLPATLIAFVVFAKISNRMKQENVFYVFVVAFLIFFAIFGFVLLPKQKEMQLHKLADLLRIYLPSNLKDLIGLIEYWNYSLFYICAELWSSIVVSLLFWQFANAVIKKEAASRFYPLFGVIADLGMILAGIILVVVTKTLEENTFVLWQMNMQAMTNMILISGLASIALYYRANRYFEKVSRQELQTQQKTHLTMKESVCYLGASPNIRYLGLMVLGFAISSNLIEVAWKCQLEEVCASMNDFTHMMGYFSILTGVTTIILMLVGGNLLRTQGWLFGALVPPFFMMVIGMIFFGFLVISQQLPISIFGYSSALIVSYIGALENIMGKSIKFSMFDPTKEMAFIPLDIESKLKGKASIDMFGTRLGKSIGSLFHQGVAVIFGSFQEAVILYLGTFTLVIGIWIYATKQLYTKYIKKYAF